MYKPWIEKMIIQQGADFWAKKDSTQTMEISLQDGENGVYVVLKTARWSLAPEELSDFCLWLKKICQEAEHNTEKFLSETNFPDIIIPDNDEVDSCE
jgi:hypothetical protein